MRRKPGQLGTHVECFGSYLLGLGYTPETVRGQLKTLGQLGRWMAVQGLTPPELSLARVEAFLADRRADRRRQTPYRRGLVLLLDHLIDEHVVAEVDPPALTALDELMVDYREWMVSDRGLAAATMTRYEKTARRFLRERSGRSDVLGLAGLSGTLVNSFLLGECARCSVGAAKGRVAELRSLLRFLYLRGLTPLPLAAAVPPVAGWHDTAIPATLSAAYVSALLNSCDRTSPVGARDFAMLMLLARLGLRSIEVARLELADVDWRAGEIVVQGKARHTDRLPLPAEVGEALAGYLVDARPATRCRRLFVTCRAPRREIRADLVSDVVRRACVRAALPEVGAHRLRHALATELLARGAALGDISQVLRHRDLATTAIYAKVDLISLRAVARPWPAGQR
jgi:site-specific recombinase XerD